MTFISEIKNKIGRTGMRNIYPVLQPPASQFLHRVLWRFLPFKWKKEKKNPTHTPYICIIRPKVHDSRWHNIGPSHDRTWLRWEELQRRSAYASAQSILTNAFFVSCFDSSSCNNGSYVKKLRYFSSSCVQMQFIAAWRGPFLRPWTYYRTGWSGVDQ